MRRLAPAGLVILLAAGLAGCATLWKAGLHMPDGGHDCPGSLLPTEYIRGEVLLREQVRVRSDDADFGMLIAARKRGDALYLVGLDGFGAKLFELTQRGVEVSVERPFGRRLPWPAVNLLRDLHRERFLALPGAPLPDGLHQGSVAGARVEEHWISGRLTQRSVTRPGAGSVQLDFDPDGRTTHVRNAACGYTATLVTLEQGTAPGS